MSTPVLRVVRGDATPEEVAALLAVVAARAARRAPPRPARSGWPGHPLRAPLHPGPGAWRASGLPH